MIEGKRDVMRIFTLAALICGLAACSESDADPTPKPEGTDPDDPVGIAAEQLGAEIMGCAEDDNGFTTGTLTLLLGTESIVLSAPAGKITANGRVCEYDNSGTATQLTTSNVTKISLKGDTGVNKVILDMLPGSFGTNILSSKGGITVDFSDGGADSFMIRGSTGNDNYKFAKATAAEDFYIDITNDKVADISVKPKVGDAVIVAASMGAGMDTVTGSPAASEVTSFAGATVVVVPMAQNMTVYGGLAVDTITGGNGDDTLYGGAGNDVFKTAAVDDGSDIYVGDSEVDTVEYTLRDNDISVDIGPTKPLMVGSINLATVNFSTLNTKTLTIEVDDDTTDRPVVFASTTSPANIVSQINTVLGAFGTASLTGDNRLVLTTAETDATAKMEIKAGNANADLGFMNNTSVAWSPGTTNVVDADDGETGEGDDVRTSVENITGGKGDDTLFGDNAKNTIKGGDGDDNLAGGVNTCAVAADGDTLQGEAGDDDFFSPAANCYASYQGGAGANSIDFSGRSAGVTITNNGTANDGETSPEEKGNIATDILKMVGGSGADSMTGGAMNEIFIGNLGADVMNGAGGTDDIVDYTGYAVVTQSSLCFAAMFADCVANDGSFVSSVSEMDNLWNIEHFKGGTGNDTVTVAPTASNDVTLEGGMGMDALSGGDGNDTLWGDEAVDNLMGGAGDDTITGGAGTDMIAGGAGDGDICVPEAGETPTGCEL